MLKFSVSFVICLYTKLSILRNTRDMIGTSFILKSRLSVHVVSTVTRNIVSSKTSLALNALLKLRHNMPLFKRKGEYIITWNKIKDLLDNST